MRNRNSAELAVVVWQNGIAPGLSLRDVVVHREAMHRLCDARSIQEPCSWMMRSHSAEP